MRIAIALLSLSFVAGCAQPEATFEVGAGETFAAAACGLGPDSGLVAASEGRFWIAFHAIEFPYQGSCVEEARGPESRGSNQAVRDSGGASNLFVTWSDDLGTTWRVYQRLSDGTYPGGNFEAIAADGDRLAVVGSSGDEVVVHQTLDGGRSWKAPVRVSTGLEQLYVAGASWTPAGLTVVAWGTEGLLVLKESDGFAPPDLVAGDGRGVDATLLADVDLSFPTDRLERATVRDLTDGSVMLDWTPPEDVGEDWTPRYTATWPEEDRLVLVGSSYDPEADDFWWPFVCEPIEVSAAGAVQVPTSNDWPCTGFELTGTSDGRHWATLGLPDTGTPDVRGWRFTIGWPDEPVAFDVPFPIGGGRVSVLPHAVAIDASTDIAALLGFGVVQTIDLGSPD